MKNRNFITVTVLSCGDIIINNKERVLFEKLKTILLQLKKECGTVWFYRESSQFQANEQAMDVFDFIIENKLPISLSSKPDFSDYIDENGNSLPRNLSFYRREVPGVPGTRTELGKLLERLLKNIK